MLIEVTYTRVIRYETDDSLEDELKFIRVYGLADSYTRSSGWMGIGLLRLIAMANVVP